jgi:hypothetical protein
MGLTGRVDPLAPLDTTCEPVFLNGFTGHVGWPAKQDPFILNGFMGRVGWPVTRLV